MSKIEVGDTFRDSNLFAHFVCTGTDGNLIYSKFDNLHKKEDCTLVVKKSGGTLSKEEIHKIMNDTAFGNDSLIREGDSFIDSNYPGCVFSCEGFVPFADCDDDDLIESTAFDNHIAADCTKITDLSYKEVKPKAIRKIKRAALEEWAFKQCGFYIRKSAGNEKKGKGNIFCFIDSCNQGFGDTIGEAIIDLRKNMRKNGLKVEKI